MGYLFLDKVLRLVFIVNVKLPYNHEKFRKICPFRNGNDFFGHSLPEEN